MVDEVGKQTIAAIEIRRAANGFMVMPPFGDRSPRVDPESQVYVFSTWDAASDWIAKNFGGESPRSRT